MSSHSKSIAAVVGGLVSILVAFNIHVSEEVQGAIITLATALSVYFAPPNRG